MIMSKQILHIRASKVDGSGNQQILYPESSSKDVLVDNILNTDMPKTVKTLEDLIKSLGSGAFTDLGDTTIENIGDGSISGAIDFLFKNKKTFILKTVIKRNDWVNNKYEVTNPYVNTNSMVFVIPDPSLTATEVQAIAEADIRVMESINGIVFEVKGYIPETASIVMLISNFYVDDNDQN